MGKVTLITGGARSGKSRFAETLAKSLPGRRAYIATCPVIDEEMTVRVARHREQRRQDNWTTFEEEIDLPKAIREAAGFEVILIDCLTLWINNLMYTATQRGGHLRESDITRYCEKLQEACTEHQGEIILVTNEVGMGIVPDNPLTRTFRDLSGRCSQIVAGFADTVVLVACGLPLYLKGERR